MRRRLFILALLLDTACGLTAAFWTAASPVAASEPVAEYTYVTLQSGSCVSVEQLAPGRWLYGEEVDASSCAQ